jgi:hypothetical protein
MLLGGMALIGGEGLLIGCADRTAVVIPAGFTAADVALLEEIAETILPETSTPGARAAGTGPFVAMMVADVYDAEEQAIFHAGLLQLEAASVAMHGVGFIDATPEQRLALLERLDAEQYDYMSWVTAAKSRRALAAAGVRDTTVVARAEAAGTADSTADAQADAFLPDQRRENATAGPANSAAAITADSPPHYFRMIKELTLLGYFTSEIGYEQAMRYEETPGRFEPCVPYQSGETAWAPHA